MLPEGRILDVGCGTGSLMMKLALNGYQVYGIDRSEECVRRTTEHLKLIVSDTHVDIKRCHATQIDFPDGFIAAEVLEHIEEDHLAVQEFYRLLRPGVYVLLQYRQTNSCGMFRIGWQGIRGDITKMTL